MGDFIQVTAEGQVARVTMSRAELHNAFNEVMIRELHEAFTDLGERDEVRAIVLAGDGKSFCAGADLNWMKKMIGYTFEENVDDAHALAAMLKIIHDCPKPVIARVHGAAFGGGVGLIAACDIAVAVEPATFSLSETKLGLLPAVISPFVLKKTGPGPAHRYFLTAERFNTAEALRIGLISEVVPDAEALDGRIEAIINAILTNGPEAVSQCKTLIEEIWHFDWDRAFDIATKMIAKKRISPEGQEGMKAFLEKRSPGWVAGNTAAPTS